MEASEGNFLSTEKLQHSEEMLDLVARFFRLRSRFRMLLPESIQTLREKIHALKESGKHGEFGDIELFYRVGGLLQKHGDPVTMGEISHEMEVPLSTATRIVDWLVANGYAQRLPDAKDRRIVRVGFTPQGIEVYHTIHQFFIERLMSFMHRFSVEERETFLRLMRKVVDGLEEGL
jgi:DNA-binding MarR family transcriptional regulator